MAAGPLPGAQEKEEEDRHDNNLRFGNVLGNK